MCSVERAINRPESMQACKAPVKRGETVTRYLLELRPPNRKVGLVIKPLAICILGAHTDPERPGGRKAPPIPTLKKPTDTLLGLRRPPMIQTGETKAPGGKGERRRSRGRTTANEHLLWSLK